MLAVLLAVVFYNYLKARKVCPCLGKGIDKSSAVLMASYEKIRR